jgi:hypothetical protein
MTPEYKSNLLRILRPILAILIGTLLTAVGFLIAGSASTACQCSRPITLAFPFAAILWSLRRWEAVGGVLMAFQFPAYALLIALGKTRGQRARFAVMLLVVHACAVILGLFMYKGQ